MEGQKGTTLEGFKSSPSSKGMDTIALICCQLICTSVGAQLLKTQTTPHCEHLLSLSARESAKEKLKRTPLFSWRQNKAQAMPSQDHHF